LGIGGTAEKRIMTLGENETRYWYGDWSTARRRLGLKEVRSL